MVKNKKLAALVCAYVILSILFFWSLASAWRMQGLQGNTCQMNFLPLLPGNNGYIEFELKEEEPVEPYFDGTVFINLTDKYGIEPVQLTLVRSAEGTYAQSTVVADLRYNSQVGVLWMLGPARLDLVRTKGAHRDFPFDSAPFGFDLKITPAVDLRVVRIVNRVSGFVMDCGYARATRSDQGLFHVDFRLTRNPLVQLTTEVLCIASVAFMVLIAFMKPESLASSVASFFFSLWSIRAILSSQIKTFPTLLDGFILTLCTLLLLILGGKLLLGKRASTHDANDARPLGK